ncbi:MAG TPA: TonB-dependent receptor [Thermoanaerobaculia bacterium]|nr:TonB-dependent receptor [Thermoanaerobaculia bacterium]
MNFRYLRVLAAMLLVAMMFAPALVAQTATTGAVEGTVSDNSGAALPGVTVEIRSPQLQGAKTEVTDTRGHFRFSLLPPGQYNLMSTLSGFSPVRQSNVVVSLSRVVTLDVRMSAAVTEQITVTAAAPVVDVTSAATGANVNTQTMQSLPLSRNYVGAAQVAPGTATDAVGTTFYGSSGAENQYIIDGLNTTAVRDGTQGKSVNLDFVQEVEVKTGGMPAEYGRLTGGAINAITKSGGNQFTGDVFGFDSPKSLRADNTTFTDRSILQSSVIEPNKNLLDYGLDLGGYFVKDRLWFFGAYDRPDRTDTSTRINTSINLPNYQLPVGATLDTKVKSNLYAGKLTFRVTENQSLTGSFFGDPNTTTGPLFAISGPPSTFEGELKRGGVDMVGRYAGIFGTNFVANAEAGQHKEKIEYGGEGTGIAQHIDLTVSPNITQGGFGFFANEDYKRNVYKADLSTFVSSHEIKFGGDYEDLKGTLQNYQGGAGQRIYKLVKSGVVYYRHRYYVNDLASGFNRSDANSWQIALPQVTEPETRNNSFYAQDSWKVVPNFTLNFGVRWESQEVLGRGGVKAFKIDNNWAPRVGAVWDVFNNGRSKAYANFGRFFEAIPMDINIRAFGGELVCFCYNFSDDPANIRPDATAPARSSLLGGSTEPVDPNLKGQHIDEFLLGYDQEVMPNLAVGIQGTYRKLANVIEDMLIGTTGEYLIANPGSGIGREAGFYEGGNVITPTAKRTYKGVELHATKHFSNNTQFFASYLWSKLEGNYDGTFQNSTGQLDPNINSAFDYADFIVNNTGKLSADRTHQLKFYGSYQFSNGALNGLNIGLATHYYSGTPLTAYGYSRAYQNWEYYLTTRGSLGRGPADYEADMHFSYPIKTGAARVNLIADIFNVLNLQRKTQLDLRYNRPEDADCTGFIVPAGMTTEDVCTADNGLRTKEGTVTPVSGVDPSKAPNPSFLKAGRGFTDPRIFRLGVRVSF